MIDTQFDTMSEQLDDLLLIEELKDLLPEQVCEFTIHKFLKESGSVLEKWLEQRATSTQANQLSTAALQTACRIHQIR